MNIIEINKKKYEVETNVDECLNEEELNNIVTDYFDDFDYIMGDYSYEKLRLKGFCDKKNERFNEINDIRGLNDYLKNYCSYHAKYFLLKKEK